MAYVTGSVLATAGRALDRRLNELAATVCDADPRTREQRRADALGALAGWRGPTGVRLRLLRLRMPRRVRAAATW